MRKLTVLFTGSLLALLAVAITPASKNDVVAEFESVAVTCGGPTICLITPGFGGPPLVGNIIHTCSWKTTGCNTCCVQCWESGADKIVGGGCDCAEDGPNAQQESC